MSAAHVADLNTLRDLTRRMTEALHSERLDIFITCAEKRIQTLKGLFGHPEKGHPPDSVIRESIADNKTWIELLTRLMAEKKAEIERVQVKKSARNRVRGAYRALSRHHTPCCIRPG